MTDHQRDELIERVAAALAKTHAAGQTTFSALAEAAFTEMIASKQTRRRAESRRHLGIPLRDPMEAEK